MKSGDLKIQKARCEKVTLSLTSVTTMFFSSQLLSKEKQRSLHGAEVFNVAKIKISKGRRNANRTKSGFFVVTTTTFLKLEIFLKQEKLCFLKIQN